MSQRTVTIVASSVKPGRCKFCKGPILWATRAASPGRPARGLPFSLPRPWPLSTSTNEETGIAFEVWPTSALHLETCPKQGAHR